MIRQSILFIAFATLAGAQDLPAWSMESFQSRDATDANYEKGLSNLDARHWEAAIANFDEAANRNQSLTDAALYWKAYALTRAGRLAESLSAVQKLQKSFPNSRWVKDAKALSMEIQADAGHPVSAATETDEDLKLLALNTLMQEDAKAATTALLQIVNGSVSDKIKEHALFVLAQSGETTARKALLDFGRQSKNQALQLTAVRMMGMMGGDGARKELAALYTPSADQALKREILNGLMLSGSKSLLLTVAKTESDPALRSSAITNLSITGGQAELSELYKSRASLSEKKQILDSVFLTGDTGTLLGVLKQEKDPGLRMSAINSLGATRAEDSLLEKLYGSERNQKTRLAILDVLLLHHNVTTLEELAAAEKDPEMKKEILTRLGAIHLSK